MILFRTDKSAIQYCSVIRTLMDRLRMLHASYAPSQTLGNVTLRVMLRNVCIRTYEY